MLFKDSHIPDDQLMLATDGELSWWRKSRIEKHLSRCWSCRTRMKEFEETISNFVRAYYSSVNDQLPAPYASRALFKARLRQLAIQHPPGFCRRIAESLRIFRRFAVVSGTFILTVLALIFWQSSRPSLALSPDPRLTPGASLPVTVHDICTEESPVRDTKVLASVGIKVFEEYGIKNPPPRHYELDYLIDPDLGGSPDTRNLWPQPYSSEWNAHVKDALEHYLREQVCAGTITLEQAQRDISSDWISAYKKYFHTKDPLPEHVGFKKDQPWE